MKNPKFFSASVFLALASALSSTLAAPILRITEVMSSGDKADWI